MVVFFDSDFIGIQAVVVVFTSDETAIVLIEYEDQATDLFLTET